MPKWPVTMGDIKFVIESDSEPTRAQMSAEYDRLKSLRLAQEERGQEFARTLSGLMFDMPTEREAAAEAVVRERRAANLPVEGAAMGALPAVAAPAFLRDRPGAEALAFDPASIEGPEPEPVERVPTERMVGYPPTPQRVLPHQVPPSATIGAADAPPEEQEQLLRLAARSEERRVETIAKQRTKAAIEEGLTAFGSGMLDAVPSLGSYGLSALLAGTSLKKPVANMGRALREEAPERYEAMRQERQAQLKERAESGVGKALSRNVSEVAGAAVPFLTSLFTEGFSATVGQPVTDKEEAAQSLKDLRDAAEEVAGPMAETLGTAMAVEFDLWADDVDTYTAAEPLGAAMFIGFLSAAPAAKLAIQAMAKAGKMPRKALALLAVGRRATAVAADRAYQARRGERAFLSDIHDAVPDELQATYASVASDAAEPAARELLDPDSFAFVDRRGPGRATLAGYLDDVPEDAPGGVPPRERPRFPEGTTSPRKAHIEDPSLAARSFMRLAPVQDIADAVGHSRRSFSDLMKAALAPGPTGRSLADGAAEMARGIVLEGRAMTDVEVAAVTARLAELQNLAEDVVTEISRKTKQADLLKKRAPGGASGSAAKKVRDEISRLQDLKRGYERQFDLLRTGLSVSRREAGRALSAYRLTVNRNYDLVSIANRVRAAKGASLTAKEEAAARAAANRVKEVTDNYEKKMDALRKGHQKEIDRIKASQKKAREKVRKQEAKEKKAAEARDEEAKVISLDERRKRVQKEMSPEEALAAKEAKARAREISARMRRLNADVGKAYRKADALEDSVLSPSRRALKEVMDLNLASKTMGAMADISVVGRQAMQVLMSRPGLFAERMGWLYRMSVKGGKDYTAHMDGVLRGRLDDRLLGTEVGGAARGAVESVQTAFKEQRAAIRGLEGDKAARALSRLEDDWLLPGAAEEVMSGRVSIDDAIDLEKMRAHYARSVVSQADKGGVPADEVLPYIHSHINSLHRRRARLYHADVDGIDPGAAATPEEIFATNNWFERNADFFEGVPGVGQLVRAHTNVAEWSGRTYAGFLNKLRADLFDRLTGLTPGGPPTSVQVADRNLYVADLVNNVTGRGTLLGKAGWGTGVEKSVGQAAKRVLNPEVLNHLFFSPRLMGARFKTPYLLLRGIASKDPEIRKVALGETARFLGSYLAAEYVVESLFDADVGDLMHGSDFGKIVINHPGGEATRLDVLGGFGPVIRFGLDFLSGDRISSDGKRVDVDRADLSARFARTKLTPFLGSVFDVVAGVDPVGNEVWDTDKGLTIRAPEILTDIPAIGGVLERIGEVSLPLTPETAPRVVGHMAKIAIPLGLRGIIEQSLEGDLTKTLLTVPNIAGIAASTYDQRGKKKKKRRRRSARRPYNP